MMTRTEKREAIRRASEDLQFNTGVPFEDARLSGQIWSLEHRGAVSRDDVDAMRPTLRRLNRLWAQRRREKNPSGVLVQQA
jgi:hypothetical protein